jgi:WD40 repeat protein
MPEPIDPRQHPLDLLSGRELLALLDGEIARLPEVYRLPLLLCVLQGRKVEEAARQLGWTIGSLRGRLARGRERLRQRLTRRGLDLSVAAVALLAPVAVPERLLAESVRQLAGPIPAALSTLASGMMPALKGKLLGLALLAMTGLGLGAGLTFLQEPVGDKPANPSPAAPPAQAKDEPRRDRYGDPLPMGAVARLGTLRFRAPGEIVALAFAPDNKTLAVSAHGGLFLFDAASGKRIKRFPTVTDDSERGTRATENLLLFSPDGKRLIRRGYKAIKDSLLAVVRVWEIDGAAKSTEYDIGPGIQWLGWSPEGQPLAIRVDHGVLHLHDVAAGRTRRIVCKEPLSNSGVGLNDRLDVVYSPAGRTVALSDNKNAIHIWDFATGRKRCTLQPRGECIISLTLSPDGKRLLSRTPQTVQMWNAETGKLLYTVEKKQINYFSPVFSADGKIVVLGEMWNALCFWDAATGKERGRTQDKDNFDSAIALSADGKLLATTTRQGGTFHLWDAATGKRQAEPVGHTSRPHGTVFFPDRRRVATGGGLDGTIHFWNRTTGAPGLHLHRPGEWVRDIALSLDGRTLFSAWTDEHLWISDADSGERQAVIKLEDPDRPDTVQSAWSMHLSDDGKRLVVLSYYYPKNKGAGRRYWETLITGWDASTHKQLFRRRHPGLNSFQALSADGRVLAALYPPMDDKAARRNEIMGHPIEQAIRLEDVATGAELRTLPTLKGQGWPVQFSPDGRLLASYHFYRPKAAKDGKPSEATRTLRLWETMTAAEVQTMPSADFLRVAFSRDNRLLAMSAPHREIVVWDLALGRERRRFKGYDTEIVCLSFSPDGRQLVSGFADSTLLIWDVGMSAPPRKLDAEDTVKAWSDLANKDAPTAFRARGALVAAPAEALELLTKRLHPAQSADAQRLRRLLADLENEQFAVREKAQEELAKLGDLAEPALRQTLANNPSLELRRRVQTVLERLRGPVTQPRMLQSLRAVTVLEDIGTPQARLLLEELAKGAPEARLTREAKASLRRLDLRRADKP